MLLKQRDSALQEGNLWRSELAKAREQAIMLEAAVVRAEEKVKVIEANAEDKIKDASEKAAAAEREKEDLLALVTLLQSQVERFAPWNFFLLYFFGICVHSSSHLHIPRIIIVI